MKHNTFSTTAIATNNTYAFSWSAFAVNKFGLANAAGYTALVKTRFALINVTSSFISGLLFGLFGRNLAAGLKSTRIEISRKPI